jgi:hypothetical protein
MSLLSKIVPALFGKSQNDQTDKPPPAKKWASAKSSHRFICIRTCSGYRNSNAADPGGENILLDPNCSDEELGSALVKALAASRFLSLKDAGVFFDRDAVVARYKIWVADLMQRYKLKTKKALFTGMMSCNVELQDGVISINPTVHHRLENWGRTKNDGLPTFTVSASASAKDIGVVLREAFSACR